MPYLYFINFSFLYSLFWSPNFFSRIFDIWILVSVRHWGTQVSTEGRGKEKKKELVLFSSRSLRGICRSRLVSVDNHCGSHFWPWFSVQKARVSKLLLIHWNYEALSDSSNTCVISSQKVIYRNHLLNTVTWDLLCKCFKINIQLPKS